MAHQGRKPNHMLDTNMFLHDGSEDSASLKRNLAGKKANLANNKPSLQDEAARSDDEDSKSIHADDANESDVDSISVATDASSGAESIDAALQGKKASSSSYMGNL